MYLKTSHTNTLRHSRIITVASSTRVNQGLWIKWYYFKNWINRYTWQCTNGLSKIIPLLPTFATTFICYRKFPNCIAAFKKTIAFPGSPFTWIARHSSNQSVAGYWVLWGFLTLIYILCRSELPDKKKVLNGHPSDFAKN